MSGGETYLVSAGESHPGILTGQESSFLVYCACRVVLSCDEIIRIPLTYDLVCGKGVKTHFTINPELSREGVCILMR